jgi:hypothetical protein
MILRGFPQQELAWAHKYLDLSSNEETVKEYRGDYDFELSQEGQGYDLHFYYRYLPPTCKVGDYDIFHLLVCLIPYEGMPKNTPQLHPVLLTNIALNTHQFLDYPSSDRQGSEASFNLVREWLAKCNSSHECRPLLPRSTPFRPTRLLYVGTADNFEDIFLSESETFPQDAKYVTLSHCWGSNPIISLQKDLVSAFKKNIPWNQLPLSIQDALVVTRKLKIKFLWIDSLCIIQDDEEDWLRESMLMAEVYSHSYLNLAAAASSDSSGGLAYARLGVPGEALGTKSVQFYQISALLGMQ